MSLNHTSIYAQLTDDQFKLIGKIVVEWANVEFLRKTLLSHLLFSPEFLGRIYTELISAARVEEAIKEAVSIHRHRYRTSVINEDVLKDIEHTENEVTQARTHRNRVAHFCWTRSNDEEIFGTSFSSGLPDSKKHRKSYSVVKNKELEKLCKESYDLVESLEKLIKRLPQIDEEKLAKWIKAEQLAAPDRR